MLTLAESYLHRIDPFAIQFPGGWPLGGLRWYGLSYAAGFAFAWLVYRWFARAGRSPLKPEMVGDLVMYIILGTLIGGRLGYILFYQQDLLWDVSGSFPFWGALAINKGGMASHGGVIGFIISATLFARRRGISALNLIDIGSLACTFGLGVGRIANFINAELWGKALPAVQQTNPPWWSVKYPTEITEIWLPATRITDPADPLHTCFLTDLARDFGIAAPDPGQPISLETGTQVINEAARRLGELEQLREHVSSAGDFHANIVAAVYDGNEIVGRHITPLLTAYYPSQIFQALTDGPILALVLILIWLKPRKPGVVGSWFLITYAILRILTEMFRQPDEGVALFLDLSRGQALSVLMLITGFVCLRTATQRKVEKLPGLLAAPSKAHS
jgi:phosphatidylglycerol:prolipoprotein diacylglycerol transferase